MSAARSVTLTFAELRALIEEAVEAGVERALERNRKKRRKPPVDPRPPAPPVSDTDMAAARRYSQRLGLHVKPQSPKR